MQKRLEAILFCFLFSCICAMGQDYKWHTTFAINGSGIIQTGVKDLLGSKWRIKYTTKDYLPFKVELCRPDGTVVKTLVAANNNRQSLSGSTTGTFPIGVSSGFLRIQGSWDGWHILFDQYVDDVKGWKLTSLGKRELPLEKIGAWSGEADVNDSVKFSTDSSACRLTFKALKAGRLKVQLLDAAGKQVMQTYLLQAGVSECWLYAAGEYKVLLSPMATPWVMEIDVLKQ